MVGRIRAPPTPTLQDIHTLIPRTSEFLLVCMAKEELRLQMKLSSLSFDLRWECFLGYPDRLSEITSVLKSGRGNKREVSEKDT